MTYFNLRKRHPEDEQDEAGYEELGEDEAAEEDSPDAPSGLLGALWAGISGPGKWLTARGRPGMAWTLYVGSAWAAGYYGGWVTLGVVVAWLAAVLAFMPRAFKDRATARAESWSDAHSAVPEAVPEDVVTAATEEAAADPHTALVGWLDDLTRGRSGIHLDELHDALTRHPQLADLSRSQMRAWLDRRGVAVERTLRVGKLAGRSGVSRATVEAFLKALPPLVESGRTKPPVHASDLHDSPVESGVERGGEHAA